MEGWAGTASANSRAENEKGDLMIDHGHEQQSAWERSHRVGLGAAKISFDRTRNWDTNLLSLGRRVIFASSTVTGGASGCDLCRRSNPLLP